MDKAQKVDFEKQIENYMEQNQIPDYFEQLTKQLIVHQPSNPVEYLVNYLENRKPFKYVYISGIVKQQREEIGQQLASLLNFQCQNIDSSLGDSDEAQNEKLDKILKQSEQGYCKGYVITGYPNTYNQVVHLQKSKKTYDRIFVVNNSQEEKEKYYSELLKFDKEQINNAIKKDELDQKELLKELQDYPDIFDINNYAQDKDDIVKNMQNILKLRIPMAGKNPPLRSPRIVLMSPPYLRKRAQEIFNIVAKNFGLYKIDLEQIIDRHIDQKTEVGKYLFRNIQMRHEIPLEITTSLVRTEMMKPVSKQKGFIVLGYPQNADQLMALVDYKINPNLIIGLRDPENILKQSYEKLQVDPVFGKRYEEGVTQNRNILQRLTKEEGFSGEQQDQVIQKYNDLLEGANKSYGKRYQAFTLSTEDNERILHSVELHMNNPSNYGDI